MMCGCKYCIYNEKNECTLGEIELDSTGICIKCIFADIPTEYLEFEKEKLRKKYEKKSKGM